MLIRYRIIISFTLITSFITIIFSWYVYYYNSLYRRELFQNTLMAKAQLISRLMAHNQISDEAVSEVVRNSNIGNLFEERAIFVDEDGRILYTNIYRTGELDTMLRLLYRHVSYKPFYYEDTEKFEYIVSSYEGAEGRVTALSAAYDLMGKSKENNLKSVLVLGNLFSFFVALFFAIFFSDGLLFPIKKIINKVSQISGANLHLRLEEGNRKDELAQIAIAFNHLLERIEHVFNSQKYFISHASHEMRTPLASAITTLETTRLYERDMETVFSNIDKAIKELKKSASLINGLLQLAKIENERDIAITSFRLDDTIFDAITSVKQVYPEQEIKYNLLSIPDVEQPFLLEGSRQLIENAIYNVLENACKYANHKPVKISLDSIEGFYIIKVEDNGLGIPETDLLYIFEPLYRGVNAKAYQGHGLGLPLVKKIINLHEGSIDIFSSQAEGTLCEIKLPTPY